MKKSEIPQFGVLQGVRVAYCGGSIAAPFGPSLMADLGAQVTWIEHYKVPDIQRTVTSFGYCAEQDRRNQRTISLNVYSEKGKEVFLKIMAETDIFIEGSRGRQWDRHGLSDEFIWEHANPKLVICHISGFGQTGVEKYIGRPSYDPIAQAFGGLMYANSDPDKPEEKILPVYGAIADYYSAYLAAVAGLSGYIRAQQTGKGESFDIAQYETFLRALNHLQLDIWNLNRTMSDFNDKDRNSGTAGYNSYFCKDKQQVYMLAFGAPVLRGMKKLLNAPDDVIAPGVGLLYMDGREPDGHKFEEMLKAYCREHTSEEVEEAMNAHGIPCTRILHIEDMLDHPHFVARESITHWTNKEGNEVIGANIIPKCKNNPTQIWRPCPDRGADNDDILEELGYSPEEIKAMYDEEIVTAAAVLPVEVRKEFCGQIINPEGR